MSLNDNMADVKQANELSFDNLYQAVENDISTNNISLTKKRVIDELFTQTQRIATANVNTTS